MAKKIKLSRKQIKQPDEFITWTERALEWAEENVWLLTGGIAGIIIVLLLGQGVRYWLSESDQAPRRDLSEAVAMMNRRVMANDENLIPGMNTQAFRTEREKFESTVAGFSKVINNHPGTVEAQTALLYLARSKERLEQYEQAISDYESFLQTDIAQKEQGFRNSALMGLGRSYYLMGEYEKAIDNYEKLAQGESPFASEALLGMARANARMGNMEKAKELLQSLKEVDKDLWSAQPANFLATYWEDHIDEDEKAAEGGGNVDLDMDMDLDLDLAPLGEESVTEE